jgi:ParB-like chromosome segregation protein Spo0J
VQTQLIKLSKLKSNSGQVEGLPKNPRLIKDEKYKKLIKSIQDDPEMLSLREVIAYDNNGEFIVICGNMRLKALKELGIKEVPTKVLPPETTVEKLKAYLIKDNVSFGEHSWDDLANEWESELLNEWGLDVPGFMELPEADELFGEEKNKPPVLKITFESPEQLQAAEIDITELIDRKYKGAFFSVSAGEI